LAFVSGASPRPFTVIVITIVLYIDGRYRVYPHRAFT
jgi:hypothetical protein